MLSPLHQVAHNPLQDFLVLNRGLYRLAPLWHIPLERGHIGVLKPRLRFSLFQLKLAQNPQRKRRKRRKRKKKKTERLEWKFYLLVPLCSDLVFARLLPALISLHCLEPETGVPLHYLVLIHYY